MALATALVRGANSNDQNNFNGIAVHLDHKNRLMNEKHPKQSNCIMHELTVKLGERTSKFVYQF